MNESKQMMIGEILIARGAITRSQLNMANRFLESAKMTGEALVDDGIITSDDLDLALGWQLAEALVGLGYASEREVFGSLRFSVALDQINPAADEAQVLYVDEDIEDLSDF